MTEVVVLSQQILRKASMSNTDCDVLVIGSGAGGGTVAAYCASMGKSVIVIERGSPRRVMPADGQHRHDENYALIDAIPYDDRKVLIGRQEHRLYMGGISGGGTSLYGAALIRPQESDFCPGNFYGDRIPEEIHRWPVNFDTFLPWLQAAEILYRVADAPPINSVTNQQKPIHVPGSVHPQEPQHYSGLPLTPISHRLMDAARRARLNPWRLPLAINSATCLRCDHCAGFECPTGARRSSDQLLEESLRRGEALRVLHQTEVTEIHLRGSAGIAGVVIRDRSTGTTQILRARRYVLAAGALSSPALLLGSGFSHPLIGRNYMTHCSPIVVGLFLRGTEADRTFIKQVGLSDFYHGTPDLPEKMGIIQSLPAPGPELLAKNGLAAFPRSFRRLLRRYMLPLVGIVEDLPNPENRVTIEPGKKIRLHHTYSDFDLLRAKSLSNQMSLLLRRTGAVLRITGRLASNRHVAHQCGTLRFGTRREHAVLDADCRMFDYPELFVADGSFMPTSLGVGPSLTIIANALRVADVLCSEV